LTIAEKDNPQHKKKKKKKAPPQLRGGKKSWDRGIEKRGNRAHCQKRILATSVVFLAISKVLNTNGGASGKGEDRQYKTLEKTRRGGGVERAFAKCGAGGGGGGGGGWGGREWVNAQCGVGVVGGGGGGGWAGVCAGNG